MSEVDNIKKGGGLWAELDRLRVFLAKGVALEMLALERLEAGLKLYVARMQSQLTMGRRDFERFEAQKRAQSQELEQSYADLARDVRKALKRLNEHQATIEAQAERLEEEEGLNPLALDTREIVATIQASVQVGLLPVPVIRMNALEEDIYTYG